MYKRNRYKKLQTKNESFLNVTSLRNNGSPEAGVSCLIHQVRSTFYSFSFAVEIFESWGGPINDWFKVLAVRRGRTKCPKMNILADAESG